MNLVFDVLTAPVLGPIKGIQWLAKEIAQEAERQYLDEGRVRAQLLELQARYDLGEVSEEEYDQQETALLEWLNTIREMKAERGQQ